ncbi:glycine-rich domain-containing protein [Yersinia rohdei]|uniref:glycine-rich domain-containing protein n=1 Tax=Yersinia rohdei TaxID=29485 RepID=UPI0011A293AA|nr:hypothetical protein [Yersinia rohdei]
MALTLLSANNASTVLSAGISASATTLTVNTGTGGLFPSPVSGTSFFKLTLVDAATGTLTEIVHVTARTGDAMTIVRGQEGTTNRLWSANDIAANMMTAGTLDLFAQLGSLGGAASLNVGTTAGTVAAGNDSRIIGALQKSANLSDLANVVTAQANLGLSPHGLSRFTSSGSFIVPEGVTQIWVSGCAAGGGGGSSLATNSSSFVTGGSGGGAGQPVIRSPITVTPGQVIPVTIGIGGTGGTAATNNATVGGNTQLGVAGALLNLVGGSPGSLGSGGATFPASYGGPVGGAGYPAGGTAMDTSSFSASASFGGFGGQGASGPFGQAGPAGRGAAGSSPPATAGFGYGAGGSGAGGAYASSVSAAGGAGAAGLNGYLVIEW